MKANTRRLISALAASISRDTTLLGHRVQQREDPRAPRSDDTRTFAGEHLFNAAIKHSEISRINREDLLGIFAKIDARLIREVTRARSFYLSLFASAR